MLINILKIRIGDLNWSSKQPYEYYHNKFLERIQEIPKNPDGTVTVQAKDIIEVSRIQTGEILSNPNFASDFISIMADSETHNFYFSVDRLEKEEKEKEKYQKPDTEFAFGEQSEDAIYYALNEKKTTDYKNCLLISSIVINTHLDDPFVHFDYDSGAFYLPRKILAMNKTFVEIFTLPEISEEDLRNQHELTELITYNFKAGYWVYKDTEDYLKSDEVAKYTAPENWLIRKAKVDVKTIQDGKCNSPEWIPVLTFPTDALHIVKTENLKLDGTNPNWDDVTYEPVLDYDFNAYFETDNSCPDLTLFFITPPSKQFLLVQSGIQNAKARPVNLALMDFPNTDDKGTFDIATNTLFLPIKSVNLHTHALLTHMYVDWAKEDYLKIGIDKSTGAVSENIVNMISKEFLVNCAKSGDLKIALSLYLYTISGLFNLNLDLKDETEKWHSRVKDQLAQLKDFSTTDENISFVSKVLFDKK